MSRRVAQQDASTIGIERAVGNVDRDALLALCAQTIRQQRQVDAFAATLATGLFDGLDLVAAEMPGLVEQAANQRALAIIDRADSNDVELRCFDWH